MEALKALNYTAIKQLRPGMKDVNVKAIVLEFKGVKYAADDHTMHNYKIADETAAINAIIWDRPGSCVRPSDILVIPKAEVKIVDDCLVLFSNMEDTIKKIGDFCLSFNEAVNMSLPKRFVAYVPKEAVAATDVATTSAAAASESKSVETEAAKSADDASKADEAKDKQTEQVCAKLEGDVGKQAEIDTHAKEIRDILLGITAEPKPPGVEDEENANNGNAAVAEKKQEEAAAVVETVAEIKNEPVEAAPAEVKKTSERVTRQSLKNTKKE